jgi:hypothetical protein
MLDMPTCSCIMKRSSQAVLDRLLAPVVHQTIKTLLEGLWNENRVNRGRQAQADPTGIA